MSVDMAAVFGLVGVIVSIIATAWMGLIRYTISLKDQETNRRLTEAEGKAQKAETQRDAIAERLRLDELATSELKGKLALTEQRLEASNDDVEEIKKSQVPRQEWETQMNHVQNQLSDIRRMLERGAQSAPRPGGYSHGQGGSDQYPEQKSPK